MAHLNEFGMLFSWIILLKMCSKILDIVSLFCFIAIIDIPSFPGAESVLIPAIILHTSDADIFLK